MGPLVAFFLIILTGLFSSTVLRRFHLPWVIALIIGGMIVGPQGLNIFTPDPSVEFMSSLGLTFLMFMAGLETKLSHFKQRNNNVFLMAFINGAIPFGTGLAIGKMLGYEFQTMFIIALVFVSSSIAVVIPALETNNLINLKIGKSILISIMLQDITSLVLLSIFLQTVVPVSNLPLYIFYPLVLFAIVLVRVLIPLLEEGLQSLTSSNDMFQDELRVVYVILIGTVIVFELLGLHSIVGGFFAGVVLSDSIKHKVLIGKIRAISYGIFIPTFFVLVGLKTDIHVLFTLKSSWLVVTLIVLGSIGSKLISGLIGAKAAGFNTAQSMLFGFSSVPQLSTTLATAYTAYSLGIISKELNTAFVALSIVSTFIGPMFMSKIDLTKLGDTSDGKIKLKFGHETIEV